ncbi:OTU domain-containing protein [Streptomyces sp. NPDC051664]|uniref:OTU domain-containing protein n=1 Tax=Streptomyces sp. NPDC051664 TaxID=3365668 RepID=UPI00379309A1
MNPVTPFDDETLPPYNEHPATTAEGFQPGPEADTKFKTGAPTPAPAKSAFDLKSPTIDNDALHDPQQAAVTHRTPLPLDQRRREDLFRWVRTALPIRESGVDVEYSDIEHHYARLPKIHYRSPLPVQARVIAEMMAYGAPLARRGGSQFPEGSAGSESSGTWGSREVSARERTAGGDVGTAPSASDGSALPGRNSHAPERRQPTATNRTASREERRASDARVVPGQPLASQLPTQTLAMAPSPTPTSSAGHASQTAQPGRPARSADFQIIETSPSGDCLFEAVLASWPHQFPGQNDIPQSISELRIRAAENFSAEMPVQLRESRALDTVLIDLNSAELNSLYDADMARQFDPRSRHRTPSQHRPITAEHLRNHVRKALDGADGGEWADHLWNRLTQLHGRGALMHIERRELISSTEGSLVERTIRERNLWNTPFGDHVPAALVRALDVNIAIHGSKDRSLFLGQESSRTLHIHYNGQNHYSALQPVARPAPATHLDFSEGLPSKAGLVVRTLVPSTVHPAEELLVFAKGKPSDGALASEPPASPTPGTMAQSAGHDLSSGAIHSPTDGRESTRQKPSGNSSKPEREDWREHLDRIGRDIAPRDSNNLPAGTPRSRAEAWNRYLSTHRHYQRVSKAATESKASHQELEFARAQWQQAAAQARSWGLADAFSLADDHRSSYVSDVTVDPIALSIGTFRTSLPNIQELVAAIRLQAEESTLQARKNHAEELRRKPWRRIGRLFTGYRIHDVPEDVWNNLPQRLLANATHFLDTDASNTAGRVFRLNSSIEVRIALQPKGSPRRVLNPGASVHFPVDEPTPGSESHETAGNIQSTFDTGAQVQSTSSTMSGGVSLTGSASWGFPLHGTPVNSLAAGVTVSATRNTTTWSKMQIRDAEHGQVTDPRHASDLITFDKAPVYQFAVRTDTSRPWQSIKPVMLETQGADRILLWIPQNYLGNPSRSSTPVAVVHAADEKVPRNHTVHGITHLPNLEDQVVRALREHLGEDAAPFVAVNSREWEKVRQQIWNLHSKLFQATGDDGHKILLDAGGRMVRIVIHSQIVRDKEHIPARIGPTINTNLEDVGTTISGTGGSHALANTNLISGFGAMNAVPTTASGEGTGIGVNAHVSEAFTRRDAISANRTGLDVSVQRWRGPTNAYRVTLRHRISVGSTTKSHTTRLETDSSGTDITSQALLHLPEFEARERGFPVDAEDDTGARMPRVPKEEGLSEPPLNTRLPTAVGSNGNTDTDIPAHHKNTNASHAQGAPAAALPSMISTAPAKTNGPPVPEHIAENLHGLGMAQVVIDENQVRRLRTEIESSLNSLGFLPPGPELYSPPLQRYMPRLRSQEQNNALLERLISTQAFASRMDCLFTDGLPLHFKLSKGFAGVAYDVDHVEVNIKARMKPDAPLTFQGTSDVRSLVRLQMAMGIATYEQSGSRTFGGGVRLGGVYKRLRGLALGLDVKRTAGVSSSKTRLTNLPRLAEFAGKLNEYQAHLAFDISYKVSHSGLAGRVRPWARNPQDSTVDDVQALFRLPPWRTRGDGKFVSAEDTPPEVFNHAVIHHIDTTGVTEKALAVLRRGLQMPSSSARQTLIEATTHANLAAHFSYLLKDAFTLEGGEPGLFRNSLAMMGLSARLGKSEAVDVTDPVTLSKISLALHQTRSSTSTGVAVSGGLLDLTVGQHIPPHVMETGGLDASMTWGWGSSQNRTITGGKEYIPLANGRAVLYRTTVTFTVNGAQAEVAKLFSTGDLRVPDQKVENKELLYLMAEPDALKYYLSGTLPLTDSHLTDLIRRWHSEETGLDSAVIAQLLMRWKQHPEEAKRAGVAADSTPGAGSDENPDAASQLTLTSLAGMVRRHHNEETAPILDNDVLRSFNLAFPGARVNAVQLELPDHLTRDDHGGRFLGHVHPRNIDFTTPDGRAAGEDLLRVVLRHVQNAAPDLLTRGSWSEGDSRRPLGTVQEATSKVQALLAHPEVFLDQMLDRHGFSFDLIRPTSWVARDVIRVDAFARFIGPPVGKGYKPGYGLEVYGHSQDTSGSSSFESTSQSITLPKQSSSNSDSHWSANESMALSRGNGFGTSQNHTVIQERTIYDWGGLAVFSQKLEITVRTRRLHPEGESANRMANEIAEPISSGTPEQAETITGSVILEVPRSILHFTRNQEPLVRQAEPVPELPINTMIAGVRMNDAAPALDKLLNDMFRNSQALDEKTQTHPVAEELLARPVLEAVLPQAIERPVTLAKFLLSPAHRMQHAELTLHADAYDLEILGEIRGSGTGRYDKRLEGTASGYSDTHLRPALHAGFDVPVRTGQDSVDLGNVAGTRATAQSEGWEDSHSPRGEGHIKEQQDLLLVRLRLRAHITAAVAREHSLPLHETTAEGKFRSRNFFGEIEGYLPQAQLDRILAVQAENAQNSPPSSHEWNPPANSVTYNLQTLLTGYAKQPGAQKDRAAMALSEMINKLAREQSTVDLGISANVQDPSLSRLATHTRALTFDLRMDQLRTAARQAGAPIAREHLPTAREAAAHPAMSPLSVHPVHLVRDIALILESYVHLRITDGTSRPLRQWWISPAGRVHAFDPRTRLDGNGMEREDLTVPSALAAGLVTQRSADDLSLWGADDKTLGSLYRTSWDTGRTLDQAVRDEMALHHQRLASIDPKLPDFLRQAVHAQQHASDAVNEAGNEVASWKEKSPARSEEAGQHVQSLSDARGRLRAAEDLLGLWSERVTYLRAIAARTIHTAPFPSSSDVRARLYSRSDEGVGNLLTPSNDKVPVTLAGERAPHLLTDPGAATPAALVSTMPTLPDHLATYTFESGAKKLGAYHMERLRQLGGYMAEQHKRREEHALPPVRLTVWVGSNNNNSAKADASRTARGRCIKEALASALPLAPKPTVGIQVRNLNERPSPGGSVPISRREQRRHQLTAIVDIDVVDEAAPRSSALAEKEPATGQNPPTPADHTVVAGDHDSPGPVDGTPRSGHDKAHAPADQNHLGAPSLHTKVTTHANSGYYRPADRAARLVRLTALRRARRMRSAARAAASQARLTRIPEVDEPADISRAQGPMVALVSAAPESHTSSFPTPNGSPNEESTLSEFRPSTTADVIERTLMGDTQADQVPAPTRVRGDESHSDASVPRTPQTGTEAEAPVPHPAERGPNSPAAPAVGEVPWFVKHGMIGQSTVTGAPPWDAARAKAETLKVMTTFAVSGIPSHVHQAVRSAIQQSLMEIGIEPGSRGDVESGGAPATELLLKGKLLSIDGKLVWVRPVLDNIVAQPAGPTDGPWRKYDVSFASTASEDVREQAKRRTGELLVGTAFNAGAIASSILTQAPVVLVDTATKETSGIRSNVITGRKLFVSGVNAFTGGLRFDVFIDGEPLPLQDGKTPVVVARNLSLEIPREYTRPGVSQADITQRPQGNIRQREQEFRRSGEILNAVDMAPVLLKVMRDLIKKYEIDSRTVGKIIGELQRTFNELTQINRRQHVATDLGGGDPTGKIRVGTGPLARVKFRGHVRLKWGLNSVQLLDVAPGVSVREDKGGGTSIIHGKGNDSKVGVFVGGNMIGLIDPSFPHQDIKGVAPAAGGTVRYSVGADAVHSQQTSRHHVLKETDLDLARYRVTLNMQMSWFSRTHRKLDRDPMTVTVDAELGIPWRNAAGAADFERRVLGDVRTPYVRTAPTGTSTGVLLRPVSPQPHFRALPERSGIVRPHLHQREPDELREPLGDTGTEPVPMALRARQGLGTSVVLALPGAEIVEDLVRKRLEEVSNYRGGLIGKFDHLFGWRSPFKGISATDSEIAAKVSPAALEADLDALLAGKKFMITTGNSPAEVGLRAHLRKHIGSEQYSSMIFNTRALSGETVDGRSHRELALGIGLGGGPRIDLPSHTRLQMLVLRFQARFGWSRAIGETTESKSYRRMENTAPNSVVHEYDVIYEVHIRPLHRGSKGKTDTYWLSGPGRLTAQVVVPKEQQPVKPATQDQLASIGTTSVLRSRPTDTHIDFSRGTGGVLPTFHVIPKVAEVATDLYFTTTGRTGDNGAGLFHQQPKAILDVVHPSGLSANLARLTSGGLSVDLPTHEGIYYSLNLQLALHAPHRIFATEGDTEIEQYSQSSRRHAKTKEKVRGVDAEASIAAVHKFGIDAGDDGAIIDPNQSDEPESHHGPDAGGRVGGLIHLSSGKTWIEAETTITGAIDITRATYSGRPAIFRADPVFKITITGRKGDHAFSRTRYVRAREAVELMVPPRRVEDILPPAAEAAERTARGQNIDSTTQAPGRASDTPALPLTAQQVQRQFIGGRVQLTSAHAELFTADDVIPRIMNRLRELGIIRTRLNARNQEVIPYDHWQRAIEAVYGRHALELNFQVIYGGGLRAVFPIPGLFGSARVVSVNLIGESIDAPHAERPRPEVKLTLRGESVVESKSEEKQTPHTSIGGFLTGRGGTETSQSHGHRHGGAELLTGYVNSRSRGEEKARKATSILRANPRKGSHEFETTGSLRLEMAVTRGWPALVEPVSALIDSGIGVVGGVARPYRPASKELVAEWAHQHRLGLMHDHGHEEPVTAHMRLLVPAHMTEALDRQRQGDERRSPTAPALTRLTGMQPTWRPHIPPPLGRTARHLASHLHSGDIPAWQVLRDWIKRAADSTKSDLSTFHDGSHALTQRVDLTTSAGRGYQLMTSQAMLRPNLEQLLAHTYELAVNGRIARIGLDLSNARVMSEKAGRGDYKSRRYSQVDSEKGSTSHGASERFTGFGPEAGGSVGADAMLGRAPFEFGSESGSKHKATLAQTVERNKEGTQAHVHMVFDAKIVATFEHIPGHQFTVMARDGYYAMAALTPDSLALQGELLTTYPEMFAHVLDSLDPGPASAAATHIAVAPELPGDSVPVPRHQASHSSLGRPKSLALVRALAHHFPPPGAAAQAPTPGTPLDGINGVKRRLVTAGENTSWDVTITDHGDLLLHSEGSVIFGDQDLRELHGAIAPHHPGLTIADLAMELQSLGTSGLAVRFSAPPGANPAVPRVSGRLHRTSADEWVVTDGEGEAARVLAVLQADAVGHALDIAARLSDELGIAVRHVNS